MTEPLLVLQDAEVRRGNRAILKRVSMSLLPGQLTILAGPNGAGKTTLLRAAAGLCRLASGSVRMARQSGDLHRDVSGVLAYLEQGGSIHWPMRVRDVVALGRMPFGRSLGRLTPADRAAIDSAISDCGLAGFEDLSTEGLSGGETARVLLARALAVRAPILLADEPIASLDPAGQIATMQLLEREARKGCAVLAVLHDLPLAFRFADRVVLMQDGRIAADGKADELVRDRSIDRVFGVTYRAAGEGRDLLLSPVVARQPRH